MSKRSRLVLAAAAAGAMIAGASTLRADVVVGDWEGGSMDGWFDWQGNASFSSSTIGVTRGSNSLKVQPNGSYSQNLSLRLWEQNLMGTFIANTQFAIDVSWQTSDWTPADATQGTWALMDALVVNAPRAAGGSWGSLGRPTIDTGNPGYPGGWDPTNFGALHTRTVTWDYSTLLDGNTENGEITINSGTGLPDFVEFIFITNFDANFNLNGAAYYFDNARFVTVVASGSWTGDTDANWSTTTNWAGSVPSGIDGVATFGAITSGRYNVNVDGAKTLGGIVFDSATSYTLSGATLTMSASAGNPSISVASGSHTIASPLTLNNWLFVNVAGGASLDLTGALTVSASGRALHKTGTGLAQIAQINTGTIQVDAGQLRISAKGTANSPTGTTVVNALVVAAGASLDLTNNSMVVDYTDPVGTLVSDVRQKLLAGDVTSSAADATHKLGYGDNAVLGLASFAGQTVDSSSLLIKYTYAGDSNLDGQVDITDLAALATAWQTSGVWGNGDFDYSGFIDITDLAALATNWQAGVGAPLAMTFEQALASVGLGGVAVPEPASLGLLILGGAGLIRRRRRD